MGVSGLTETGPHLSAAGNHWILSAAAAKSLQSCLILCNPIDGSPPGSSVHGILQARTLEWVAISFSLELLRGLQMCLGFSAHSSVLGSLRAAAHTSHAQASRCQVHTDTPGVCTGV